MAVNGRVRPAAIVLVVCSIAFPAALTRLLRLRV